MKTITTLLLVSTLSLAAFGCSSSGTSDEPDGAPSKNADRGRGRDAEDESSGTETPPDRDEPSPSDSGPPAEQPPELVGVWAGYTGATFNVLRINQDGTGRHLTWFGQELDGQPDAVWDQCTWRVTGDSATPTYDSPWRVDFPCEDYESYGFDVVEVSEDSLGIKFGGLFWVLERNYDGF